MTGIRERIRREAGPLVAGFDARTAVILVSASVVLMIYRCYGSSEFFDRTVLHLFRWSRWPSFYSTVYSFLTCFLLMFILPAVVMKVFFRKGVREFGFRSGEGKTGLMMVGVLFPLIALILVLPACRIPAFRAEYPLFRHAGETLGLFLLYELLYGFYYLGWESFFRGYMLFGLRDRFGAMNSILIQTIPSTLMHIGKPQGEIFASILAGIVFGFIALRTRSIFYVFILHWLIGIAMDTFVVLSTG